MKIKEETKGLGDIIYSEWLLPIIHYYATLRKNEFIFEVALPIIIAIISTRIYAVLNRVESALQGLANILPSAISILIGFTAMLITILLTSNGENVEKLKKIKTEKKIFDKNISLYQNLHIQLSHSLFAEIILLLIIFFQQFMYGIVKCDWINNCMLIIEIFLILNILLSILRGITNIYFSFYNQENR